MTYKNTRFSPLNSCYVRQMMINYLKRLIENAIYSLQSTTSV